VNKTAALRGWTELGLRKVLLPSGAWIRIRLPSLDHLFRKGAFPHELEAIVIRFTMGTAIMLDQLSTDELREFLAMKDHLIAYTVKQRLVSDDPDAEDAEWEDVDLTPYVLDLETVLPAEDLDKLGLIALRRATPETVTVDSRMRLGLLGAVGRMKEEEESGQSAGEFRGMDPDAERAAPGSDGQDVSLQSERSAESEPAARGASGARSRRRASDRSGASSSSEGG
jgi:hypothetical protein